jgi:hypothetical protein
MTRWSEPVTAHPFVPEGAVVALTVPLASDCTVYVPVTDSVHEAPPARSVTAPDVIFPFPSAMNVPVLVRIFVLVAPKPTCVKLKAYVPTTLAFE